MYKKFRNFLPTVWNEKIRPNNGWRLTFEFTRAPQFGVTRKKNPAISGEGGASFKKKLIDKQSRHVTLAKIKNSSFTGLASHLFAGKRRRK